MYLCFFFLLVVLNNSGTILFKFSFNFLFLSPPSHSPAPLYSIVVFVKLSLENNDNNLATWRRRCRRRRINARES